MSFWTSSKLKAELRKESLITPFDLTRVQHGAYELALGGEYYDTSLKDGKGTKAPGSQITIPPGQLALLITQEKIEVPDTAIAFISVKFTNKQQGLINVSGFHVDPGFRGRIKFSVYNAGSRSAVLDVGKPLFMIWFSNLIGCNNEIGKESEPYNGRHQDQAEITAKDVDALQGDIASPAALKEMIDNKVEAARKESDDKVKAARNEMEEIRRDVRFHGMIGTILAAVLIAGSLRAGHQLACEPLLYDRQ